MYIITIIVQGVHVYYHDIIVQGVHVHYHDIIVQGVSVSGGAPLQLPRCVHGCGPLHVQH